MSTDRSGDFSHGELWIPDSQIYTSFKGDWIDENTWPVARQVFLTQFPTLSDANAFIQQTQAKLDIQMAEANQVWPDLQDEVWIENDNEHLARLEATELPAGVTRLQERLTSLFPRASESPSCFWKSITGSGSVNS